MWMECCGRSAEKSLDTANSYATWRYQVPISFSAKPNQTQRIAWKIDIFTFLELTKSKEFVFKHHRSVCVPFVCLVKHFLTCLIQIHFLRFLQMLSKRNWQVALRVSRELSFLTHLMHNLSQRMERVHGPDIISSSKWRTCRHYQ